MFVRNFKSFLGALLSEVKNPRHLPGFLFWRCVLTIIVKICKLLWWVRFIDNNFVFLVEKGMYGISPDSCFKSDSNVCYR